MDRIVVKEKLIEVLQKIQERTPGITCIEITGDTRPLEEIPKFDSKAWPGAVSMLAIALGVSLPNDQNIFRAAGGRQPLTVDEVVERVWQIIAASPAAGATSLVNAS